MKMISIRCPAWYSSHISKLVCIGGNIIVYNIKLSKWHLSAKNSHLQLEGRKSHRPQTHTFIYIYIHTHTHINRNFFLKKMKTYGAADQNVGLNHSTVSYPQEIQEESRLKRILGNRWLNLFLFIVLWAIVFASIACVTVVSVLQYHLLFVCGYAEFILLVALEGCTLAFCFYHIFNIFQMFKKRAQHNPVKGPFAWFINSNAYQDVEGNEEDEYEFDEEEEEEDEEEEESRATKIAIYVLKFLGFVIGIAAMIALLLFTVVFLPLQQRTLPQTTGTLTLRSAKLQGPVPPKIIRESNGIVHIEASADYDAFFAQGVAHAQDRMWQLEFNKRIGAGTLSEIAGSDAKDVDMGSRTLGFRIAAQNALNSLSKQTVANMQAYCDGINAYLDSNPPLSPEFSLLNIQPSKWEPIDVATWSKVVAFSLSANHQREIIRYRMLQQGLTKERIDVLLPLYPKNMPTVLTAEELNITLSEQEIDELEALFSDDSGYYQPAVVNNTEPNPIQGFYKPMQQKLFRSAFDNVFIKPLMAKASNNWVVAGFFSKSGKPLLANDPHLEQTAPGIWYLNHIKSSASGLDVIGASFIGSPGVIIGRNKNIAWGVTNGYADVQDIYAIKEDVTGVSYIHNGISVPYEKRVEVINVKGKGSFNFTVLETLYGPVINEMMGIVESVPLSLHWVGRDSADTTADAFMKLNYALNFDDFLNAMKSYVVPSQNFVYADTSNNIGYILAGKIPIRKKGQSGRYVVPGNGTFDYFTDPNNYIPFGKLPQIYNPSRGFVASANNRVAARGYAYSISQDFFQMFRAERIEYLLKNLTANSTLSMKNMQTMQYDVKSFLFEKFRFVFTELAGNVSKDIDVWRDKLAKWDADEKLYSQEASIFELWYYLMGTLIDKETNNKIKNWRDPTFLVNALKNGDVACEKYNMTCLTFAGNMLKDAVTSLENTYGSIPLWGSDIHQVTFVHPLLSGRTISCLASKTIMNIGGTETVNVGDIVDQYLTSTEGVSYRQIIDMANSYTGNQTASSDIFIIPLGQSGNFLSPLYANFLEMWKNGEYTPMRMSQFETYRTITINGA
jgi:penicillin amidase